MGDDVTIVAPVEPPPEPPTSPPAPDPMTLHATKLEDHNNRIQTLEAWQTSHGEIHTAMEGRLSKLETPLPPPPPPTPKPEPEPEPEPEVEVTEIEVTELLSAHQEPPAKRHFSLW